MKNLNGIHRRELEYFDALEFKDSLKRTANNHGYFGSLKVILFGILKFMDYLLSMIAYFAPYAGIRVWCQRKRGVKIGQHSVIGYRCVLDEIYPDFITIEDNVSLAGDVYILTHSNPYEYYKDEFDSFVAPVHIKKNAWITINVTILPGVTIGEGSVITAGSVVTKDVPDHVMAGGVPAKIIKEFKRKKQESPSHTEEQVHV